MTTITRPVLEVLAVDDEQFWRKHAERSLTPLGYNVSIVDSGYGAIDQMAIRIHSGQKLPDIYLCDMLDRGYLAAKIKVPVRWSGDPQIVDVHMSMAFNLHHFLNHKGIVTPYFIGQTAHVSDEDLEVAKKLMIPLIKKDNLRLVFPDVSGLNEVEALAKFAENLKEVIPVLMVERD